MTEESLDQRAATLMKVKADLDRVRRWADKMHVDIGVTWYLGHPRAEGVKSYYVRGMEGVLSMHAAGDDKEGVICMHWPRHMPNATRIDTCDYRDKKLLWHHHNEDDKGCWVETYSTSASMVNDTTIYLCLLDHWEGRIDSEPDGRGRWDGLDRLHLYTCQREDVGHCVGGIDEQRYILDTEKHPCGGSKATLRCAMDNIPTVARQPYPYPILQAIDEGRIKD